MSALYLGKSSCRKKREGCIAGVKVYHRKEDTENEEGKEGIGFSTIIKVPPMSRKKQSLRAGRVIQIEGKKQP